MRVVRWLAVAVLVSFLLPAVSSAQEPTGSIFFTDERLETSGFADCRDAHMHGMSKDAPEDGEVQVGVSYGPLGCRLKFQYAVEENIQLEGDVTFIGFLGCEVPTLASPAGSHFRFHLFKNGAEISQKAIEHGDCSGDFELTETVSSGGTAFAPGDTLGFEIVVWYLNPDEAVADNMHLKVGSENPSRLEAVGLPNAGGGQASGGPALIHQNLTSPAAGHTFENATSDTYILNFTSELENATAAFAWNAANGSVQASLHGVDGILFEGVFEGNGSHEEILEGVQPGAWNLTLQYTNFTGTFGFSLDAYEPEPEGGGPNTSTTTATASPTGDQDGSGQDGNATGNQTLDGGGDQESPALPLVLAGLVVLAIARFRRR